MSLCRCDNCYFFRRRGGDGECHRSPPVRLPRRFASGATSGNRVREEEVHFSWPTVEDGDWCGEWQTTKSP